MDINRNEVLRYLGYRKQFIDSNLSRVIDSCIEEIKSIAKPLKTYRVFNVEASKEEVRLLGCDIILRGKDIVNHLKNSKRCAILSVSLGAAVDNRIRYLSKADITRSIILDSAATEAVESLCSLAESEIKEIAKKEGLEINYRYSPGYGDFSLNIQPEILRLLNAEKNIGLTCTENYILLPRKSVTAVIGFVHKGKKIEENRCNSCNAYSNCLYRRDGVDCGF